jgi:NAD(P)-dependent dehydrogenase (short-subunit alcohol dehydrogenase family)
LSARPSKLEDYFGRKVALLQLDVANLGQFDKFSGAVRQALETTWQRKSFDFLINNAGIDSAAPFDKMTASARTCARSKRILLWGCIARVASRRPEASGEMFL